MGAVDVLVGSICAAVGLATVLIGRRLDGVCALGAGLMLSLVATGTVAYPGVAQRVAAAVAAPVVAPLLAMSVVTRRAAAVVAIVGGLVAGLGSALFDDPFRNTSCAVDCYQNPIALAHDAVVSGRLALVGATIATSALASLAYRIREDRWRRAALAIAGLSPLLLIAHQPWAVSVAAAACIAVRARDTARVAAARRRVEELVVVLRSAPQDVAELLRRKLGDDSVEVFFPVDVDDSLVDQHGHPAGTAAPGLTDTDVRARGRLLARVRHDARNADVSNLADALDAPARLAVENSRLAASVAVRRRELTEERRRIVERADGERRALERDVHDGAQQHVLALGLELRVARRDIEGGESRTPDDDRRLAVLDQCLDVTGHALDDLRELSHGLYPSSLDASGLRPCLRTLARRAAVPVALGAVPDIRLPIDVERAVFAVVADAVTRARNPVRVELELLDTVVMVRVEGAPGEHGDVLPDRVAVVGGTLHRREGVWEAVFPCASS